MAALLILGLCAVAGGLLMGPLAWAEGAEDAVAEESFTEETVQEWLNLGLGVYDKMCSACHLPHGGGRPDGDFPALRSNRFVTGDVEAVARTIHDGRFGMPSFKDILSTEELAAVISYIRNAWGNSADAISPEELLAIIQK